MSFLILRGWNSRAGLWLPQRWWTTVSVCLAPSLVRLSGQKPSMAAVGLVAGWYVCLVMVPLLQLTHPHMYMYLQLRKPYLQRVWCWNKSCILLGQQSNIHIFQDVTSLKDCTCHSPCHCHSCSSSPTQNPKDRPNKTISNTWNKMCYRKYSQRSVVLFEGLQPSGGIIDHLMYFS